MAVQTLTIDLPESLYQRIQKQSRQTRRTVAEELVAVVVSALPAEEEIAPDIEKELAALEFLSDAELWQAARVQVSEEISDRLQSLLDKEQREGLTQSERTAAQSLAHYHNRVMLVRAKSAVILSRRGLDISQLAPTISQ